MKKGYTPNHPGGNGDKKNGKGVGDLPEGAMESQRESLRAHENTDFDKKEGSVQRVVGE